MLHNQPDRFLSVGVPRSDSTEVDINLYDLITQALKNYHEKLQSRGQAPHDRAEFSVQLQDLFGAYEKASSGPISQFKLDLSGLDRLNQELDPKTQDLLIGWLGSRSLNNQPNFVLKINFKNVFLVSDISQQDDPSIRYDYDIVVDTVEAYKNEIQKLSYRLGKILIRRALWTQLEPERNGSTAWHTNTRNNITTVLPWMIATSLHKKAEKIGPDLKFLARCMLLTDLINMREWNFSRTTILNFVDQYAHDAVFGLQQYFCSAEEAEHSLPIQRLASDKTCVYLGFGPATTLASLKNLLSKLRACELVIVLRGRQYLDEEERIKIYEEALQAARERSGNLHIFMLHREPQENLSKNLDENRDAQLVAFRLEAKPGDGLCTPLENKAGYYLSSPKIFAEIFKNKQREQLEVKRDLFLLQSASLDERNSGIQTEIPRNLPRYLTEKAEPGQIRKLKVATKQELKKKLRINQQVAQQQSLNQEQEITQDQEVSQSQALTQNQVINQQQQEQVSSNGFNWSFDFEALRFNDFCQRLKDHAISMIIPAYHSCGFDKILQNQGYLINDPNHRRNIYHRISHDQDFVYKIASYIFRVKYIIEDTPEGRKIRLIELPASIKKLDADNASIIIRLIPGLIDGIDMGDYTLTHGFFGVEKIKLKHYSFDSESYHASGYDQANCYPSNNFYNETPAPLLSALPGNYPRHLESYALLDEQELNNLALEKKQALIELANRLLTLFTAENESMPAEQKAAQVKRDFLELIEFYFPEEQERYALILTKLFSESRQNTPAQFKILLHVPLVGGKELTRKVLELLCLLDKRCLLVHFYKLFLENQADIMSITNLLINKSGGEVWQNDNGIKSHNTTSCTNNTFIKLAALTPEVSQQSEWPVFYKFYHHYLLLLTTKYIGSSERLSTFKAHWRDTRIKFLTYLQQDENKADQLLELMASKLVSSQGLNLGIMDYSGHILAKFDRFIDAAIENNTLEEQIENIAGISLIEMDSIYAIRHNGLKVISAEMEIELNKIDSKSKKYSVTLQELEAALSSPAAERAIPLKTQIYRYLGGESNRLPLSHYRQLLTSPEPAENVARERSELVIGWMVARSTGRYHDPSVNLTEDARSLISAFNELELSSQDTAAALHCFSNKLPPNYDFRALGLILRLVKKNLKDFDSKRFTALLEQLQQQHLAYGQGLLDLLTILVKRADGDLSFKKLMVSNWSPCTSENLGLLGLIQSDYSAKELQYLTSAFTALPSLQKQQLLILINKIDPNKSVDIKPLSLTHFCSSLQQLQASTSSAMELWLVKLYPGIIFAHSKEVDADNKTNLLKLLQATQADHPLLSSSFKKWKNKEESPPSILTKAFSPEHYSHFLKKNKAELMSCIKALSPAQHWLLSYVTSSAKETWIKDVSKLMAHTLIEAQLRSVFGRNKDLSELHQLPLDLVNTLYPIMNLEVLAREADKLDVVIRYFTKLSTDLRGSKFYKTGCLHFIYEAFKELFTVVQDPGLRVELSEVFADEINRYVNHQDVVPLFWKFINALSEQQTLLKIDSKIVKPAFSMMLEFIFSRQYSANDMVSLLDLAEKLLLAYGHDGLKTLDTLLTAFVSTQESTLVSSCKTLEASQLVFVATKILSLEKQELAHDYLKLMADFSNRIYFKELAKAITSLDKDKSELILSIGYACCKANSPALIELIRELNALSERTLIRLFRIIDLHSLDLSAVKDILKSASIEQAIALVDKNANSELSDGPATNIAKLIEKIEAIKYKPMAGSDEDLRLNLRERQQLLKDFLTVDSLIKEQKVLVEVDSGGNQQSLKLKDLSENEFHKLFKKCRRTLISPLISLDRKHQVSLLLIALACKAVQITLKKLPREEQILAVLNSLNHSGNVIHEIRTAEGKGITAALHAVLFAGMGKTVDVITWNNEQCKKEARLFRRVFVYLGIASSKSIIEPTSEFEVYVEDGINNSTAENLALFWVIQLIMGNKPPENRVLIGDEIDTALTTTVENRLAAAIDPIYRDKKMWRHIYQHLLAFIKDEGIFSKNECSQLADVKNLRTYIDLNSDSIKDKRTRSALKGFVKALPDTLLDQNIDYAVMANSLEEKVDYLVVDIKKTKTKNGLLVKKTYHYAAPILDSTKRADPAISWEGAHPLLHTKLNMQYQNSQSRYRFSQDPSAQTIVTTSAKNFFDDYYLRNSRVIGLTATAGSALVTRAFYQRDKFTCFSHPSFHPDLCIDLGVETASNQAELYKGLFRKCIENQAAFPGQPLLIFAETPKVVSEIHDFLISPACREELVKSGSTVQYYDGREKPGQPEEVFIESIGMEGYKTVATESLARAIEPDTEHPLGPFVINTSANITEADLRQMRGRTARKGRPGKFLSHLNAEQLELKEGSDAAAQFKLQQKAIETVKHQDLLARGPLHEIRHYIVDSYYLRLKNTSDAIIKRQQGRWAFLIDEHSFLEALHTFNKKIEEHYKALAEEGLLEDLPLLRSRLVDFAITNYSLDLDKWLKEDQLAHFSVVEPAVQLASLTELPLSFDAASIKDLAIISELSSEIWKIIGNQDMVQFFKEADLSLAMFKPYFRNEQSFMHVLCETLYQRKRFVITDAEELIAKIQPELGQLSEFLKKLPLIGGYIPTERVETSINQYLGDAKTAIHERRWDALTLPTINEGLVSWIARIQKVLTGMSYVSSASSRIALIATGPLGILLNYIIIPVVKQGLFKLIKQLCGQSSSLFAQLVVNLDTISTLLSTTLFSIVNYKEWDTATVAIFLEKFKPLLENKQFLDFLGKVLDHSPYSHLSVCLPCLADLPAILEPYSALTLKELLNTKNLMTVVTKLTQLESVRHLVKQEHIKKLMIKLVNLSPEIYEHGQQLGGETSFKLLKILAHPQFSEFLAAMPEDATFGQMKAWLESAGLLFTNNPSPVTSLVPARVKEALLPLKDYQENHERKEQGTRDLMAKLKQQFTLTPEKVNEHLAHLHRQPLARINLNMAELKPEEAKAAVVAPLYVKTSSQIQSSQEPNLPVPTLPSVQELVANPESGLAHLEELMPYAALSARNNDLCQPYLEELCHNLLSPSLEVASKKILPQRILPIIHKLADLHADSPQPSRHELLKQTALELFQNYQGLHFKSFDRSDLVDKLIKSISQATSTSAIHAQILAARKTLFENDVTADKSWFRWLFGRFRNNKGHSRLLDHLDLLASTSSSFLLAEGKAVELEASLATSFSTTIEVIVERMGSVSTSASISQKLKEFGESIERSSCPQDKQFYMNAAYDTVSAIDQKDRHPSVSILIDSLLRANIIRTEVTNMPFVPASALAPAVRLEAK